MWLEVDFGTSQTGIGDVGIREYDNTGATTELRTEVGIVEIGGGGYGINLTPNAATVGVEWDSGATNTLYAHENFPDEATLGGIEAKIDTIDTNVDEILLDTAEIGPAGAGLTALASAADLSAVNTRQILIEKILRNRTETNPITGVMTVYDDNNVTPLLTANLYDDVAGTIPYNGAGADRRNRLT